MEANTKMLQLTFDKGLTNVPSDAVCDDNSLEVAEGLVYRNGEHRPVQWPMPTDYHDDTAQFSKLLMVHRATNADVMIALSADQLSLLYFKVEDHENEIWYDHAQLLCTFDTLVEPEVRAIGNTLIVTGKDDLMYFLWNKDAYEVMGTKIPEPDVEIRLATFTNDGDGNNYFYEEVEAPLAGLNFSQNISISNQNDYNNSCRGAYSTVLNHISSAGGFSRPFAVRTALKLRDGGYTYVSAPILVFPSFENNLDAYYADYDGDGNRTLYMKVYFGKLYVGQRTDYSAWRDIVDGVYLFVTNQIPIYDTTADSIFNTPTNSRVYDGYGCEAGHDGYSYGSHAFRHIEDSRWRLQCFRKINKINDLLTDGVFYKLAKLTERDARLLSIDPTVLSNITTQDRIKTDDYFSRSKLKAGFMYDYNSRLILANVYRSIYEGLDKFLLIDLGERSWIIDVHIKTQDGEKVARRTFRSSEAIGYYFYYPDSRAYRAVVYREYYAGRYFKYNIPLEEHPASHGAYYYFSPSGREFGDMQAIEAQSLENIDSSYEYLPNVIMQSEVNNPSLFPASGEVRVGNGKIMALTTNTHALSQGQHGQHPLLVFSSDGIWGVYVDREGKLVGVDPVSRDVCNNKRSIIQTDDAVYFTSPKGLMRIVGSQVTYVSAALSGRDSQLGIDLDEFFKSCFVAYDYRDSLLWLFNVLTQVIDHSDDPPIQVLVDRDYQADTLSYMVDGPTRAFVIRVSYLQEVSRNASGPITINVLGYQGTISTYTASDDLTDSALYAASQSLPFTFDSETLEEIDHWNSEEYFLVVLNDAQPDGEYDLRLSYTVLEPVQDEHIKYNKILLYSLENGTFSEFVNPYTPNALFDVVNYYPDFLLIDQRDIYSLSKRVNINDDTNLYDAKLMSRPLKLENPLALKTIMQMKHIRDIQGTMGLILWASNDLRQWVRLNSLHGRPWKYYKFEYLFAGLKANDTFSGTVVVVQERRTNKLR